VDNDLLDALKQRLECTYPGWHFWRGRTPRGPGTGDLNATRKAHITDDLVAKGLSRTLPMGIGHNVDLEQQLMRQERTEVEIGYAQMAVAS
jgi:hypothetical protein